MQKQSRSHWKLRGKVSRSAALAPALPGFAVWLRIVSIPHGAPVLSTDPFPTLLLMTHLKHVKALPSEKV